tara:strand:+ start:52291 stop:54129 length:1839 start_codon:yes stop_codon:yes gene_type:complete
MDANKFLNYNLPNNIGEEEQEAIFRNRRKFLKALRDDKGVSANYGNNKEFTDLISYISNEAENNEDTVFVSRALYLAKDNYPSPTEKSEEDSRNKVFQYAVSSYASSLQQSDIHAAIQDIHSEDNTFNNILEDNKDLKNNFLENLTIYKDNLEERLKKEIEHKKEAIERHNKEVLETQDAKIIEKSKRKIKSIIKNPKNILKNGTIERDKALEEYEKKFREKYFLDAANDFLDKNEFNEKEYRNSQKYKEKLKKYEENIKENFNPQAKIKEAISHGGDTDFFPEENEYFAYLYEQKLKEAQEKYGIERKNVIFGKFRKEKLLEENENGDKEVLMTTRKIAKEVSFNKFPQEDDKYTLMALKARTTGITKPEIFVSRNWSNEQKEMFVMKTLQALTEHAEYDIDNIKLPKKLQHLKEQFKENRITSGLKETNPKDKDIIDTPNKPSNEDPIEDKKENLKNKTEQAGESPEGDFAKDFKGAELETAPTKLRSVSDANNAFKEEYKNKNSNIDQKTYITEKIKAFSGLLFSELENKGFNQDKLNNIKAIYKPENIIKDPKSFEDEITKNLDSDISIQDLINKCINNMPSDENIEALKEKKKNTRDKGNKSTPKPQ